MRPVNRHPTSHASVRRHLCRLGRRFLYWIRDQVPLRCNYPGKSAGHGLGHTGHAFGHRDVDGAERTRV